MTINRHTFVSSDIIESAMMLFNSYEFNIPIRSISVKVSGIKMATLPVQTDMFMTEEQHNRKEKLEFVTDEIRSRFGHFAINRAIEYLDKKLTNFNPKGENTIFPNSYFQ